jgi:hypothetical protein
MGTDVPVAVAEWLSGMNRQIEASKHPVQVIFTSLEDIKANFPDYHMVQRIRMQPAWRQQAEWLSASPQAQLELYNPLVMSKLRLTRDAARFNPFHTTDFLWIDGMCVWRNAV